MKTYRIAVYGGDGIGAEVVAQSVRVLEAVQAQDSSFELELKPFAWGGTYWAETGNLVPPGLSRHPARVRRHPLWRHRRPRTRSRPHHPGPLIKMRQQFDQYACVRPASCSKACIAPWQTRDPRTST